MSARDELVCLNFGLVHSCCQRYRGRGIDYDDLFQAGCMGLVKAAEKFEPARGLKFSTYAVPVILGEIKGAFRNSGSVKVSRALRDLSLKISQVSGRFENENLRKPTVGEIAGILDVSPELVAQAENASCAPISLTIITDGGETAESEIGSDEFANELIDVIALREVLSSLDDDDRRLIKLRYFSGLTQTKTAAILGMSQVQVSRKEKSILRRLRLKMAV